MKNWKVSYKNVVTMATVFSKCLQNTHQNIPHKILGKCQEISASNIKPFLSSAQKTTWGGTKFPSPGLDRAKAS